MNAKKFGKKEEISVITDIETNNPIIIDLSKDTINRGPKKFWVDLQSIKVNGSKHLAIVDANQYDVVKKKLMTCNNIYIQNNNLKKIIDQYKNRGFFARLFNW